MMRKCLFLFLLIVSIFEASAQISFQFSDGIYNETLKAKAEKNISLLLTEINSAANAKRPLNLSNIQMTTTGRKGLNDMWEGIHLKCLALKKMVKPCLEDATEYEVREIPVEMMPLDDTYKGEMERELTISFNGSGEISGVRLAMEDYSYLKIMEDGNGVQDERQRLEILKFVEDFRSYYVEKNIHALEQIFSDDALIITGRVINTMENDIVDGNTMKVKQKIKLNKQTKQEYISNLTKLFANNKYINIDFDNIDVMRSSSKEGIYGVRLQQKWNSQSLQGKTYADDGFVFLLWDFTDRTNPKIHVRQWTPNTANVTNEDLLSPDDFFIP